MNKRWAIVWVNPRPIAALLCARYRGLLMHPFPKLERISGRP